MRGLTTGTGCALQALTVLQCSPDRMRTREIAIKTRVPEPYLAKILHRLTQLELVEAKRGYHGGFQLAPNIAQKSVEELIAVLAGPCWEDECVLGWAPCPRTEGCPLQSVWGRYQAEMRQVMADMSLADLARLRQAPPAGSPPDAPAP